MKNERISVLLATEGTYPFANGGVSTWCHTITQELENVDFEIYAMTGEPKWSTKYALPANVKNVYQIPLWGTEEPSEFTRIDQVFADVYQQKKQTSDQIIQLHFLPLFRNFLAALFHEDVGLDDQIANLHKLYHYFQTFDYKTTLTSEHVWSTFKNYVINEREAEKAVEPVEATLEDLTTAMRWIYHYFMPLSAKIPKTDIAHTTIAGFGGIVGCISKLEYGTPLLVTEHGVFIRERYFAISKSKFPPFAKYFLMRMSVYITRLIYHLADQISPVANFNKKWELQFGAALHKITTIYNGIDPHVFMPGEKPGSTRGTPTVVAAANIIPLKDIETMIRACNIVRKEIPNVQFRVYGSKQIDPAYTKKCKALIKHLRLQDHFLLAGYHNNPAKIYNEGDVTVLSSISEAFPYTVLESMACARPVVATDVGGVREALEGYGILVPPKDAQALANGLITLLKDIELRQRLGKESRERVLLMFRISQSVKAYWDTYKALMQDRNKKAEKQSDHKIRHMSTEDLVLMWKDAL